MTTISVAVQHAPWASERVGYVRHILHALRGVERVTVVADHDREGIWPTAKKCWSLASGTHHLVLQDDAELCPGFLDQATKAVEANPDAVISFFAFAGKAIRAAQALGVPWVQIPGHATALAVLMPTPRVHEFLAWERAHVPASYKHDDMRVQWWLALTGRELWFTAPCLVDHLGDKLSVAGNRPPLPRVAPWFIREPAFIDWRVPYYPLNLPLKSKKIILSSYYRARNEVAP